MMSLLRNAKNRVAIATLYIGDSQMEQELLRAIPSDVPVTILLDGLRGTRRENPKKTNSVTRLTSVETIHKYCPHAVVSQYITPHHAGIGTLLPSRVNEILGTQHMKIFCVDDTVLISGANLSDIYFTNRQDRYVVVEDGILAAELVDVIDSVKSGEKFPTRIGDQVDVEGSTIQWATQHMAPDRITIKTLQSAVDAKLNITLCSPYLSLSPEIVSVLKSHSSLRIVTGAPTSNAFHGSTGVSQFIPAAYECMQSELMSELPHAKFLNFTRPGWTFHPKGVWVAKNDEIVSTVIGSSNFGNRSRWRDLEILFRIDVARNHRGMFQRELEEIINFSQPVLAKPVQPMWIKLISNKIMRNFL
jgi:CDP-diacylglycerol---glycerol-3-phosphate 3-phosphatidyltransferase